MSKAMALFFLSITMAFSAPIQEMATPERLGLSQSPHTHLGTVSPSGKWAFGTRYANDSLDTLVIWKLGSRQGEVAHIAKRDELPNWTAQWVGDGGIYFAYMDKDDNRKTRIFLLDVSDITGATQPVLPKSAARRGHSVIELPTGFRFSLASANPSELIIRDMRGKIVRRILSAAGRQVIWRAEDSNGRRVEAGTYGYLLKQDGSEHSGTLAIGQ